jgi:hypothetical protein
MRLPAFSSHPRIAPPGRNGCQLARVPARGQGRKVQKSRTKSRSREVKKSRVECRSKVQPLAWESFVNSSTARLLDSSTFRRNKPGMSMKTKRNFKMPRSADRRFCGPRLFMCHRHEPQTSTAEVCATRTMEQTGNVYENKGQRREVRNSGSRRVRKFDSRLSTLDPQL